MNLPKIENIGFMGIIVLIILAFFYMILGASGMMAVLGIVLFFVVPFYLMLNNFELEQDEKLVFSFLIGVGLFPSLVYWLGIFISFKVSIFITFAIYIIVAYLFSKFLGRSHLRSG